MNNGITDELLNAEREKIWKDRELHNPAWDHGKFKKPSEVFWHVNVWNTVTESFAVCMFPTIQSHTFQILMIKAGHDSMGRFNNTGHLEHRPWNERTKLVHTDNIIKCGHEVKLKKTYTSMWKIHFYLDMSKSLKWFVIRNDCQMSHCKIKWIDICLTRENKTKNQKLFRSVNASALAENRS